MSQGKAYVRRSSQFDFLGMGKGVGTGVQVDFIVLAIVVLYMNPTNVRVYTISAPRLHHQEHRDTRPYCEPVAVALALSSLFRLL